MKHLARNYQTTIFISSHLLTEVSKLATRIGIVDQGKLLKEIDSQELKSQLDRKLLVKTSQNERALEILQNHNFSFQLNSQGQLETGELAEIERPEEIAKILVREQIDLKMLSTWEEDLESYFLKVIGQK